MQTNQEALIRFQKPYCNSLGNLCHCTRHFLTLELTLALKLSLTIFVFSFLEPQSAFAAQSCQAKFELLNPTPRLSLNPLGEIRVSEERFANLERLKQQLATMSDSQEAIQEQLFSSIHTVAVSDELIDKDQSDNFLARSLRQKVRESKLIENIIIQAIEQSDIAEQDSGLKAKLDAFSQFDNFKSAQQSPIILEVFARLQNEYFKERTRPGAKIFSQPLPHDRSRQVKKSFSSWWNDLMGLDPSIGYLYLASELYIFSERLRKYPSLIKQIIRSQRFNFSSSKTDNHGQITDPRLLSVPKSPLDFVLVDLIDDDDQRRRILKRVEDAKSSPLRAQKRLGLLKVEQPTDITDLTSHLERIESEIAARKLELDKVRQEAIAEQSQDRKDTKTEIKDILSNIQYQNMNQFEVSIKKAIRLLAAMQPFQLSVDQAQRIASSDPAKFDSYATFKETSYYLSAIMDELLTFFEFHSRNTVGKNNFQTIDQAVLHIYITLETLNSHLPKINLDENHFSIFYGKMIRTLEQIYEPYFGKFNKVSNMNLLYSIGNNSPTPDRSKPLKIPWELALAEADEEEINKIITFSRIEEDAINYPPEYRELIDSMKKLEEERDRLKNRIAGIIDQDLAKKAESDEELMSSIYQYHTSNMIDKFWGWLKYISRGNEDNVEFVSTISSDDILAMVEIELPESADEFDIEELAESLFPAREKLTLQMSRTTENRLLTLSSFFSRLESERTTPQGLSAGRIAEIEDHRRELRSYLREISNQSEAVHSFIDLIQARKKQLEKFEQEFYTELDYMNRIQDSIQKTKDLLDMLHREFQEYLHFLIQRYQVVADLRKDLLEYRIRPTEEMANHIRDYIYRN